MEPIRVYGISNMDVIKMLYREGIKPALVATPFYIALLVGGSFAMDKAINSINSYCKGECKISVGGLKISYSPKTLDTLVK